MKTAVLLLALLPFVFSAHVVQDRFIESLLGGYDILGLAKQLLGQFGTDETEAQCEAAFCPELVEKIDGHNPLITHLVCGAACKEAQILAQQNLQMWSMSPWPNTADPWPHTADPWPFTADPWSYTADPWHFTTDPWLFTTTRSPFTVDPWIIAGK